MANFELWGHFSQIVWKSNPRHCWLLRPRYCSVVYGVQPQLCRKFLARVWREYFKGPREIPAVLVALVAKVAKENTPGKRVVSVRTA